MDVNHYWDGLDFYSTLTLAINDLAEHGYDSVERLQMWQHRLRRAAVKSMVDPRVLERTLIDTFKSTFRRQVDDAAMLRRHPGVGRFTLERVKPALRSELDRRIMAASEMIKLNREKAIQDTLQRLSGWVTSIPAGGSDAIKRSEAKASIRKSLSSLPFAERRCIIDQSHKFVSNLNDILAQDAGAIAAVWHSHWREKNYNYREDHKERDEKVYLIRGNWAQDKGFVKVGPAGYYDRITKPGEEVFCRCFATFIYALSSMPTDMITAKGRGEMHNIRIA